MTANPGSAGSDVALTITITMLSDWHCGTGTGVPGGVNRKVSVDADGLPYIPAKTLNGVWRDACEIAAASLDGHPDSPGRWHAWVEYLFGSQPALTPASRPARAAPRPAALSVRPAVFPSELAADLAAKPRLVESVTFTQPGVEIDDETGRAADDLLRFEQMARAGSILTASGAVRGWSGLTTTEQQQAARAVLLLGARLVEGVGGKRRRGAGRCTMAVDGLPALDDDLVAWLRRRGADAPAVPDAPDMPDMPDMPDEPQRPGSTARATVVGGAPRTDGGGASSWESIGLRLELATPLLVHDRTVGNAVIGLGYVPGTVLLPAVLRRLAPAAATDLGAAARRGDLLVTNATVEVGGQPGRPVPHTWMHPKGKDDEPVNLMVSTGDPENWPRKKYRGYYVGHAGQSGQEALLTLRTPGRGHHTHNVISDKTQRPTAEVGGLFTYDALASRTVLRTEIRLRSGLLRLGAEKQHGSRRQRGDGSPVSPPEARLSELLAGEWSLGRSSKDDYGRVHVTVGEHSRLAVPDSGTDDGKPLPLDRPLLLPSEESDASGTSGTSGADQPKPVERLRVWLLSDVLLRNDRLRPSTDLADLGAELGRRLSEGAETGKDAVILALAAATPSAMTRAASAHRSESWHRRWQLPRPTLVGLAAGSVLTFNVFGRAPSAAKRAEVQICGIGERRAEGFGQVAIEDDLAGTRIVGPVKVVSGAEKPPRDAGREARQEARRESGQALSPEQRQAMTAYAQLIEKEAWRAEIRRVSAGLAATSAGRARVLGEGCEDVPRTQLASLHDVLRRLGDSSDGSLDYWLERQHAKHDDARLRAPDAGWPKDVREKVETLLKDRDTVWELLGLADSRQRDNDHDHDAVPNDGAEPQRQAQAAEPPSGRGQPAADGGPAGSEADGGPGSGARNGAHNGVHSGESVEAPVTAEQLTIDPSNAATLRQQLWPEAVRTVVTDCLTALRREQDGRRWSGHDQGQGARGQGARGQGARGQGERGQGERGQDDREGQQ